MDRQPVSFIRAWIGLLMDSVFKPVAERPIYRGGTGGIRTRTPGPRGKPGAKISRHADEKRLGMRGRP